MVVLDLIPASELILIITLIDKNVKEDWTEY